MTEYIHHYVESGLDNVYIYGIPLELDDSEEALITIPAINDLHRVIAKGIISHQNSMSGTELRFLRTEMGLTQAQLAELVHRDKQSIGRWERSEIELDAAAEVLIRRFAIESLSLDLEIGIDELSKRSVPGAVTQAIAIDFDNDLVDSGRYELRAA
ncbi:MAG: helix-turn-helix domain-containing protein [Pseudomonadota bacterium]